MKIVVTVIGIIRSNFSEKFAFVYEMSVEVAGEIRSHCIHSEL